MDGVIVELGGGSNPFMKRIAGLKSVNVDIQALPGVDVVRNLEEDFSDIGSFDGLYSQYLLEHISWRKVPHFLEQCYAILKPEMYAIFVCPDTYAQLQKIMERSPEKITEGDSCFLYGGQEHPDNTHKWLISRPFLKRLMEDAGFTEVDFVTYPDPAARDMFVIGKRPAKSQGKAMPTLYEGKGLKIWHRGLPDAESPDHAAEPLVSQSKTPVESKLASFHRYLNKERGGLIY